MISLKWLINVFCSTKNSPISKFTHTVGKPALRSSTVWDEQRVKLRDFRGPALPTINSPWLISSTSPESAQPYYLQFRKQIFTPSHNKSLWLQYFRWDYWRTMKWNFSKIAWKLIGQFSIRKNGVISNIISEEFEM